MNNKKIVYIYIGIILLSPAYGRTNDSALENDKSPLQTSSPIDDALFAQYNIPDEDDYFNDISSSVANQTPTTLIESSSLFRATPESIITILEGIDALQLLQEALYIRTNRLKNRNIIDMPLCEPPVCLHIKQWTIGGSLFWNQTNRSHFTQKSTALNSYLALSEDTLINKLENSVNQLKPLFEDDAFNINIRHIFSLFENLTVQERRIGATIQAMGSFKYIHIRLFTPLYYRERNFFLTIEEQHEIEKEFGAVSPEAQKKFQEEHLISDKFGLGDTRFEFDGELCPHKPYSICLGAQVTMPTAFAFVKGLKGSSFEKDKTSALPLFDFDTLFALAEGVTQEKQQHAFDMIRSFLLGAIDRLAANLLDAPLGNDGHFGLGGYVRSTIPLSTWLHQHWAHDIGFYAFASLEYLFPAHEKHFFIKKISTEEFATRDFNSDTQAANNLTFLEQEFVDKFYTLALDTSVHPGIIGRIVNKLCYSGHHIELALGNDIWVQTRDRLRDIQAPPTLTVQLDHGKARPLFGFQDTIFGTAGFSIHRPHYTIAITVYGAGCVATSGIGKDISAALNINVQF